MSDMSSSPEDHSGYSRRSMSRVTPPYSSFSSPFSPYTTSPSTSSPSSGSEQSAPSWPDHDRHGQQQYHHYEDHHRDYNYHQDYHHHNYQHQKHQPHSHSHPHSRHHHHHHQHSKPAASPASSDAAAEFETRLLEWIIGSRVPVQAVTSDSFHETLGELVPADLRRALFFSHSSSSSSSPSSSSPGGDGRITREWLVAAYNANRPRVRQSLLPEGDEVSRAWMAQARREHEFMELRRRYGPGV
ncbi:hypothetical protein GGR56DRAFT_672466 [Xylariaceae sp. FL0804]|nr:hypothetical protein GGR56DRAFT_672466 [Xylariaceae sp. FL0804]